MKNENKQIEEPKDLQVEFNSKEGALWKQTKMNIERQIEVDKIQAEINRVIVDYCEKKVLEDRANLENAKKE